MRVESIIKLAAVAVIVATCGYVAYRMNNNIQMKKIKSIQDALDASNKKMDQMEKKEVVSSEVVDEEIVETPVKSPKGFQNTADNKDFKRSTLVPIVVEGQNVLSESPIRTTQDDFEHLVAQCNFKHEKRKEEFQLACEHARDNPFTAFSAGEVLNVAIQEKGVYMDVRYKSKYTNEMQVQITHKLPPYSQPLFQIGDFFSADDQLAKPPYNGVKHDIRHMENKIKKTPSAAIKVGTVYKVKYDANRNPIYVAVRYTLPRYGHVILHHPVIPNKDGSRTIIQVSDRQVVNINQCLYK